LGDGKKTDFGGNLARIQFSEEDMYDVIVAGAGPAGAVAAKKCAEQGLKTLLLERRKLPRDKVCSGMIVGCLAKALVEEAFGRLPQEIILSTLSGLALWVPGAGRQTINSDIAITWRRDLDYWMTRKAIEKGVEVWDRATVKKLASDGKTCWITVQKTGMTHELAARFVIGADGTNSTVRKFLFPEIDATYSLAYRECYSGSLDLEQRYAYIVFPAQGYRPNFWILPKGDCFTVEGGLRALKREISDILTPHGFGTEKPLWKDGCLSRVQLSDHPLPSAAASVRGNVILTGDAARLKVPVSGEGIGTALKSGMIAADSIVESLKSGLKVSEIFTNEMRPLFAALRSFYDDLEQVKTNAQKTPEALLDALTGAFEKTIEMVDF
jgi:geranylgeranyl reductase family protein